ncbi:hypothetical protein MMC09_000791 [Bachmanniomyces sp. S44760]|nr:hypothetical protein [Bachmanniomyces sp. S44760]
MLKSILKKPREPGPSPNPRSREDRNRELALYHAHLIQYRKDIESMILDSLELLIDSPTSSPASASRPSKEDTAAVKINLELFQPSDYVSLIEERNINGKCGYVLCPLLHRPDSKTGTFRVLRQKGKRDPISIVETGKMQHWCSMDCEKMAGYIGAQLNDEPAWTRTRSPDLLKVVGEPEDAVVSLSMKIGRLDVTEEQRDLTDGLKQLALERGGRGTGMNGLLEATVMEKPSSDATYGSSKVEIEDANGSIEGYYSSTRSGGARKMFGGKRDDSNDLLDAL